MTAGTLFGLSVFLQAGVKFDSLQTAFTLLPYSASYAVVSFVTPNLAKKILPKFIVIGGSILTILSLWWLGQSVSMEMAPMDILPHMIVLGIGMGLIMAQITTVTMSTVGLEEAGEASGLSETLKEILGQGFAVALAGSVLFGAVYASMADSFSEIEGQNYSDAEKLELVVEMENKFESISSEEEEKWVNKLPEKTRAAYPELVKKAAESGFKNVMNVMILCMALGLLLAIFLPTRAGASE